MGMTRTKRLQREARKVSLPSPPRQGIPITRAEPRAKLRAEPRAEPRGEPSRQAPSLGLTITLGLATLPPTLTVALDNGGELSLLIEGETGLALAELLRRQGARCGLPEGSAIARTSPRLLQPLPTEAPARRYNEKGRLELTDSDLEGLI